MRKILMATVVLPLALGHAGVTLAQSAQDTQRNANNSQATAELFYMIQQLQGEVRRLQGEVEEQRHLINRLQQQGRDRYIDLDQRILDLSEKVASQPAPEASTASNSTASGSAPAAREYRQPDAEERKAYEQIQDLIRNQKKYDEAISRIYEFIDEYPEGDLTVNAYYWLGEVYLVKPQLEQAKQAFTIVATRFSDHRKAPDAVYKLGVTHDRLGEKDQARRTMQTVIEDYPSSSAADLARKFLES
ncbi:MULTISPECIES: tol-pal system protein YbgF [Marinobacter]|jgi:tol-pal system protein YbgF|uniref:tol-pal system protein YbgF n=1 Tax=Marinobacter TaxID=2742 RepID=UPI0007D9C533|nr:MULTISPECIES: tol-pal system protein YbgF [Marinobacter]MBL3825461.1 tol-pal system protein YbgF [Marinobacter sp. MC3]MBL3893967.1 tol-pal system protein YbgF [Marinobacter sp. MW3]MCD1648410.1 tol-pal system protein YbgF [Marinobacter adhaerens]OAN87773.1 tol-pal system protein YbgF [Marinobacter sp. EhN04]OAN96544.1 tol-pal system protein YbgF [Marinobacter sp. EhC06]